MKIIWSPLAVERMEEISDHIACDSASAANRWIDSVFGKVDLLTKCPEMGRIVPELKAPSIREIIFGNYRIIYRVMDRSIRILTVRNFKQILPLDDLKSER
jgi:plasmid stabilization system protein ParE